MAARRLLRRAISLEDLNTVSAIHHALLDEEQEEEEEEEDHPITSANMAPILSDTQPAVHHHYSHLQQPRPHRHSPLSVHPFTLLDERPQSAMSFRDHESYYALYRPSQDLQGPVRPLTPEASDDTHHSPKPSSRYNQATHDGRPVSPSGTLPPESTLRPAEEATLRRNDMSSGPLQWLNALPLLDAFVNWIEGPANGSPAKRSDKEKPNPLLDIPFQFIALLTYPEPDPKLGNKMSLAMVRETSFVRQRRKTLLMLTAYTLTVRYCSFDFFLVVLFASNCALLFLMKNSGRINVNMAKRAVGQRVGWAKQWAGGFFKRSGGAVGGAGTSQNQSQSQGQSHCEGNGPEPGVPQQQHGVTYSSASSSKSLLNLSATRSESIRSIPASIAAEKADSALEGSPQIKRRGLFGKKKTLTINASASSTGTGLSIHTSTAEGTGTGDESTLMGRAPRRGFFKRSSTTAAHASGSTTITSPNGTTAGSTSTKTAAPSSATLSNNLHNPPASILTPRPSINLPSSPLVQSQSLHHLSILPPRSPSPSAIRKDNPFFKGWSSTPPLSQPQHPQQQEPHHHQQHQLQQQQQPISPLASNSSSASSSPKASTCAATTANNSGRSLAYINPISFLAGFSNSQRQHQHQHQQQQHSSTQLKNPTGTVNSSTTPLSPQPKRASGCHATLLSHTLPGTGTDITVYEVEMTTEDSLENDVPLPNYSCSLEPWLDSGLRHHLDHRHQPHCRQELQQQDQFQTLPYQMSFLKDTVAEEMRRLGYGAMKDELLVLDPVTSAAAGTMERFDREA
ncbi:hypothetical protein BGX28_002594 [Mortierella sp. GBA30]|nr:hypothetical protein BGX28_002594 [Mortierella sp. GBA30]